MKRILIVAVTILVISGVVGGGYLWGYQRGYHHALLLQKGTFVGTLDALDKIRAGNVPGGTRRIESLCFMSADIVYGEPAFRHDRGVHFIGQTFIDDLTRYRRTYRTNSAEWTPMERSLEKNLSDWRSP